MIHHYITLPLTVVITLVIGSCQSLPRPESPPTPEGAVEPRQLVYLSGRPQPYSNVLPFLEPQFQYQSPYAYISDKPQQPFPRVQPQLLLYPGGADSGHHHFLLQQPGLQAPPGNFLIPHQPGPNVFVRGDGSRPQQHPSVFVAGYPKPAHIPPIEKDAEEIPTNADKIPPIPSSQQKPEKLETFNESDNNNGSPGKSADKIPFYNTKISTRTNNLRPGQRFFILNGQSLFSNYPLLSYPGELDSNLNYRNNDVALSSSSLYPSVLSQDFINQPSSLESKQILTSDNHQYPDGLLFSNSASQQINDDNHRQLAENLVLLNQPSDQTALFRTNLPVNVAQTKDIAQQLRYYDDAVQDDHYFNKYQFDDQQNDAVIVDAREQDESDGEPATTTLKADDNGEEKAAEPTIAQAQPAAIALAGPGGVAEAAPRGNAFVGKGGVAVSSPQATAVAGPAKDREDNSSTTKQPAAAATKRGRAATY